MLRVLFNYIVEGQIGYAVIHPDLVYLSVFGMQPTDAIVHCYYLPQTHKEEATCEKEYIQGTVPASPTRTTSSGGAVH